MNALQRLSRRHRRNQTQPDHPFAVDSCEYLTDGAFALLRITGTGPAAPVALVTQGDKPESFDPLPQPDAGSSGGAWHIAFAVPAELAEPGTRLWLHDGGVYLADLLVPAPAQPVREAQAAPPAPPAPPAGADLETEAAMLRERLSDREAELAAALTKLLDSRKGMQPAEDVAAELAEARAELEMLYKHAREARARATENEQQLVELREQVKRLEQEVFDAEVERTRLAALVVQNSEQAGEGDESGKPRRRGIGRRNDDRSARRLRAELEARLAEREERIEQLEKEAESFAARRDDALAESMKERIAELETEVREHATCTDDLRALLTSERELVAAARREVHELKQQLATARAGRVSESAAVPEEPAVRRAPIDPPPWSALDDELLARIEKAKALTG